MTRLRRRLLIICGTVVMIPVALYLGLWLFFGWNEVPSNIVAFAPAPFHARADGDFFYSIGNELKYSDQIDPRSPTLIRGRLNGFLVSPDNHKIAVVADGRLVIVGRNSILRQVTAVDSIYREPKPLGKQFVRDEGFQWSRDSRVVYLIRDEYYQSRGSQLFSSKGELWAYDVASGSMQLILKPFAAHTYFLGLSSGVYFSTPTGRGDLQLRYFDGQSVTDIDEPNARDIRPAELARDFVERPFYSFSIFDYTRAVRSKGVNLVVDDNSRSQRLAIGNKAYLAVTRGKAVLKGPYYCSEMLRSVFLPGDRYFLFNLPNCGNYNGQILIDRLTGEYGRLPANTVVYLTLNTDTYSRYRITGGGIDANYE